MRWCLQTYVKVDSINGVLCILISTVKRGFGRNLESCLQENAPTADPPTPSVPFAGRAPCYRRSIDRIGRSRTSSDDPSDLFFHYHLQTWQRVAEAVHGLQGSHAYCNREGRRSALAVVALLDARRCLSSTTTRDRCAG